MNVGAMRAGREAQLARQRKADSARVREYRAWCARSAAGLATAAEMPWPVPGDSSPAWGELATDRGTRGVIGSATGA